MGGGARARRGAGCWVPSTIASAARGEAQKIHASEDAASVALAGFGADLMSSARTVLTHCNTGALATGGRGSALGVCIELAERHEGVRVGVRDCRCCRARG